MEIEKAPYYADLADGPPDAEAYWVTAPDGVRLRVGVWPYADASPSGGVDAPSGAASQNSCKGTVFILPGRTECVEKYGRAATDLAARGYASLAIDWRGQGMADRALDDPSIGHVADYAEYQSDLETVIALAENLALPKPWVMLSHSMGGAIALRALTKDHPFSAAVFSAPMWGIGFTRVEKLALLVLGPILTAFGLDKKRAPLTKAVPYVLDHPFEGNVLTTDADMYTYMADQIRAHAALGLGGPSGRWVLASVAETEAMEDVPSPDFPVLCFFGSEEQVMAPGAVRERMARWPKGELIEVAGAQHEIPMEAPATRKDFFDRACALFDAQSHAQSYAQSQAQPDT